MPFESNTDLPDSVKDVLPDAAQTIFRNVFNSQSEEGLSEERSFASAWSALQSQGWELNDDTGMWVKKEDETKKSGEFKLEGTITKLDEDQRLVFGWASVIDDGDGNLVKDHQDDVIRPEEMEKMAYNFVLNVRAASEMHNKSTIGIGKLVESVAMTTEKQLAMGIAKENHVPQGLWVGFKVDQEVFNKIKSGDLRMFSIGGRGTRTEIEE